ncbi:ATP-binding protein [Lacinutrix sp. C3R15]|uniref:AAA family ATPase n=1 Tax=Flavobacteriaceae TaxID=49546 RepID=UPI001C0923A2|nr:MULTISPECIES: ATP-binding protein [Flavobacteriaceae]MBU2937912.1 ATP-binding protein [Lacinutrix sp. C3R15]MDO6621226.1 ATP-binding protein [Oceanihabitans sp. 1_MG-2023]
MIVEFSVKNFRSLSDLQTLSFVATNLKSSKDNQEVDVNNIIDGETRLLKTVGIYGANASGKSNIIKAFEYFCEAISSLPSPESRLGKLTQPFLYQNNYEEQDSFFQIVLLIEGKKYRYGFTVKKNPDYKNDSNLSKELVTSEWLFGPKNVNQVKLFSRKSLEIDMTNLPGNESIAPLEYEHTLFLIHAASYNKDICAKIRNMVRGYITSKFNLQSDFYRFHSIKQIEDPKFKTRFLDFLKSFGLIYNDIYFKKENDSDDKYSLDKVFLTKKACHAEGKVVTLNMQENESEGTKKLFDIAGLLIHALNIQVSGLIILDEIDSNFHPSLLIKVIKLFNDPNINKANAQLLFTSHDTNLMSASLMRRDQFYFTEKESNEGTKLYSLADLKGIRNDADFAKQYLAGFYGGVPVLSDFLIEKNVNEDGALGD